MDRLIVRTKLQAVIARSMLASGLVRQPAHLLLVVDGVSDDSLRDLKHQSSQFGVALRRTSVLLRSRAHQPMLFLRLLWLIVHARLTDGRVFVANLNWVALGLALRCFPAGRIHTFDDGAGNLSTFHSTSPSTRKGLAGSLSRRLFPKGVAAFTRSRIVRHASIYPQVRNVVPEDRIDHISIEWRDLVSQQDVGAMPNLRRRILLGSVYSELRAAYDLEVRPDDLNALIAWSDLHIPHPRDEQRAERSELMIKYPAECFIAHCASRGRIVVAHFNSSVALSFRGDARIEWVDLLHEPLAALLQTDAPSP